MATWGSDPLAGNPKYTSIRTLSHNGRSFSKLALDRSTGEKVAIKFTQRGWDEGRVKYMLRELLIHQELSACHHPHIVELKEVFLTPSHLAAVTEYVEGEDLQTFLGNTGGRVSEALGRFLFQQLVLALDFCHARGKVSRGVKLANTLLALSPGQLPLVKLADFGFSKDTGRNSAPSSQVGTALFVPPEVMHNFSAAPYDGALVDVWACGIVLFMLLFGRHPCLRPEDSTLSEQQQMLALFTRVAGSQFCLLPEEAAAISPGCADLLGHMLKTEPKERYSMAQVQAHPWFKQGLPAGAALMNATILAEASARPLALRQSPEALAALVQHGQQMDSQAISSRFGSSPAAAAAQQGTAAAAVGSSARGPTSAVNIPTSPPAAAAAAAARGGGCPIAARVASSTAAAAAMGSSMDEDQGMSWGAPPPARLLIHSCSSNDKAAGLQYKQQEDQMLRSGMLPPARFHMSESMSSSHGSFVAAAQQQHQQQRQELASLLESIPSAGLEEQAAYSPHQQQQQQPVPIPHQRQQQQQQQQPAQQQQFTVWLPQVPVSSSTTSAGGAVAASSPAAAAAGHMASEAHSVPAGSVSSGGFTHPHSTAAAAAGGPAGFAVSAPLLQNMQGLALQQQVQQQQAQLQQQQEVQQRQQQLLQQQQQQHSAPAVNGARNMSLLNSADLETLLQLDKAGNNAQQHEGTAAAAAAGGGVCDLDKANSFMLLLQGINSLPLPLDNSVDQLLDPGANPLLAAHIPGEYSQQQVALQQQQQQQQQQGGGPYSPAQAASPAGNNQQQQQQQQQGVGALDLPDDYAAFLVDEDDLAAVGARGAEGQRGAVRAGAGAGVSSCSLDLRQLSDLLMGGSDLQLLEGSAWHKICKDVSFSRGGLRSGPAAFGGDTAAPSDTVDDATTGAAAGIGVGAVFEDDDIDALLGLRDMSITR